jgi:hypothetical protein
VCPSYIQDARFLKVKWRCLLRVTTLDYVLLKDRNLALGPRQGPEINF